MTILIYSLAVKTHTQPLPMIFLRGPSTPKIFYGNGRKVLKSNLIIQKYSRSMWRLGRYKISVGTNTLIIRLKFFTPGRDL